MDQVANIGGRAARYRLMLGLFGVSDAVAIVALQMILDGAREWRLLAFLPLLLATYGLFQYRQKTCVLLASRGVRDMGQGIEPVVDARERYRLQDRARGVHVAAIIGAALVTLGLYLI